MRNIKKWCMLFVLTGALHTARAQQAGEMKLFTTAQQECFVASFSEEGELRWIDHAKSDSLSNGCTITCNNEGEPEVLLYVKSHAAVGNELLGTANNKWYSITYAEGGKVKRTSVADSKNVFGNTSVNDALGNRYVVGSFSSRIGLHDKQISSRGGSDVFIAKYDVKGNMIWLQQIGGTSDDYGYGIAVDAKNNVYVTGSFSGEIIVPYVKSGEQKKEQQREQVQSLLTVSPNPAKDMITVYINDPASQGEEWTFLIFDNQGKEVMSGVIRNKGNVLLQGLKSGSYRMRCSKGDTFHTAQFIVN